MTEQLPSRTDARNGRLSTPERVGRAVGVALFWVPAVLFIALSTYSVVGQVFMLASATPQPHSAVCEQALQQMATSMNHVQLIDKAVRAKWNTLLDEASATCGHSDPSIQEITAVLLRLQKRAARNETAFERDQARLTRALAQYVAPDPPYHE